MVRKYLAAAEGLGLSATGPPPTEAEVVQLRRLGVVAPQLARLEPYREQTATWLDQEPSTTRPHPGPAGGPRRLHDPAPLCAPGRAVAAAALDGAPGAHRTG